MSTLDIFICSTIIGTIVGTWLGRRGYYKRILFKRVSKGDESIVMLMTMLENLQDVINKNYENSQKYHELLEIVLIPVIYYRRIKAVPELEDYKFYGFFNPYLEYFDSVFGMYSIDILRNAYIVQTIENASNDIDNTSEIDISNIRKLMYNKLPDEVKKYREETVQTVEDSLQKGCDLKIYGMGNE